MQNYVKIAIIFTRASGSYYALFNAYLIASPIISKIKFLKSN